jgi:hypothetical protein
MVKDSLRISFFSKHLPSTLKLELVIFAITDNVFT